MTISDQRQAPRGYKFAATYAGIRAAQKDDLALIVSGFPAAAAAVFTTNRVQAAPVRLARKHVRSSKGRVGAVLINAGNANCATRTGDRVALETCRAAARLLHLPVNQVMPASTGVIGVELDPTLITRPLSALVASLGNPEASGAEAFSTVARAIMTTDTLVKETHRTVAFRGGTVRISGMTKGSGMIHPGMATTLGFLLTDAEIAPAALAKILKRATDLSYNRVSVDGDMSTNDTLVLMANGASGVKPEKKELAKFEGTVIEAAQDLAKQIARDGEGARKLITIEVSGAATDAEGATIARAIANSPLVKTAIAGSDPNWGRIICAAGYSGAKLDPAKVDISLQGIVVCKAGLAAPFDETDLKNKLDEADCSIRLSIKGPGKGKATFWTCDFTEGYIRINGSYRT